MVDLIWIAPDDLFQTTEAVTALRSQITRNLGNGNLYVAEKMVDLVGIRDDLFHAMEARSQLRHRPTPHAQRSQFLPTLSAQSNTKRLNASCQTCKNE